KNMTRNLEEKFVETLAADSAKNADGVVGDFVNRLTDAQKRVCWILVVMFFVVSPAGAQQTDDLQKQLEQLKQQYEQTTRALQDRISALEQQIKKENEDKQNAPKKEGVVSAAEAALQDAKKSALGQNKQSLQGQLPSEPTYDLLRDAESKIAKLEEQ